MTSDDGSLVIRTEHQPDALVFSVYGHLNKTSTPALERALDQAGASDAERLVIDLSALEAIDTAGIGALVNAHRTYLRTGRELALVRGPEAVHRRFDSTGAVHLVRFDDGATGGERGGRILAPPAEALKRLLAVASDFDQVGGTSLGLSAWELEQPETNLAPAWFHAIVHGLLKPIGVDEQEEEMWRLTELGRQEIERLT